MEVQSLSENRRFKGCLSLIPLKQTKPRISLIFIRMWKLSRRTDKTDDTILLINELFVWATRSSSRDSQNAINNFERYHRVIQNENNTRSVFVENVLILWVILRRSSSEKFSNDKNTKFNQKCEAKTWHNRSTDVYYVLKVSGTSAKAMFPEGKPPLDFESTNI